MLSCDAPLAGAELGEISKSTILPKSRLAASQQQIAHAGYKLDGAEFLLRDEAGLLHLKECVAQGVVVAVDIQEAESSLFVPIDPAPLQLPCSTAIRRALKLLSNAAKPFIIIGKGAAYSQAENALKEFIE